MIKPLFNRVAVLGLGLIGSSFARAIKDAKLASHIAAYDISQQNLDYGTAEGFIDSKHSDAGEACTNADLILFATPPLALETLAKAISPFIKAGAIVTDVTSVKRQPIAAIKHLIPEGAYFVPSHPIAGKATTGPNSGQANLFSGKRVILTPEESDVMSESVMCVRNVWESAGAKIEYMPAELHDRIYAAVSHLPQIIAFACAKPLRQLPTSQNEIFQKFTRLAHSDAQLWSEICLCNADYIREALADFITFAIQISGELAEGKETEQHNPEAALVLFPKVIATCLIASVSQLEERTTVHPALYAGSGFTDMTAPARDDPQNTLEAISNHHKFVAKMLNDTIEELYKIQAALSTRDLQTLRQLFSH
jgi:cyclohexadieny/prephenate dehydrogenase